MHKIYSVQLVNQKELLIKMEIFKISGNKRKLKS